MNERFLKNLIKANRLFLTVYLKKISKAEKSQTFDVLLRRPTRPSLQL
jgi:hypothetical protein